MNKEKKTKASIDNIYTLNGKVPLGHAVPFGLQHILAMFVANIAANYYCSKRLQIIKWADCYVDSECYADCRNWYVNTVVSNLACWFGTADCNGN